MKYRLGDYTIKNWNDWDRVPRDPVSIGSWLLSSVGLTTAAGIYAVSFAVGYIATTLVTSWLTRALAPKPDFGSAGLLVNNRSAIAPHDFVYGEVRKGGIVTFMETTGAKNKYLHQIIVLAGHELNNIGDIYINDKVANIDSDGFVSTAGTGDEEVNYDNKIRIYYHLGAQTSTTTPFSNVSDKNLSNTLLAESELTGDDALDSNFVGKGLAYFYVRYEYKSKRFPNGLPIITAKVQGKKVYDPRNQTTAYSTNAALCVRDFITSAYGLNDSNVDDTTFQAAANICDEDVNLNTDPVTTENRYTINGVIQADRPIGNILLDMMTACAGNLFWGAGAWKLVVGEYSAPVKTLTLDDLRGPISLNTRTTMRDNFNAVGGTFIDANQDFITADYPRLVSEAFKDEDGGEEVVLDLPLPFTTSAATAQRIAKMTLFRGREQMTLSADFGLEAFEVEVGDIIAFTNERYGFNEKEFEVVGWRLAANQDAGDLRVNLTLRETSEAAFDWDAEESDIISNNTTLPNPFLGIDVTGLSVTTGAGVVQGDGTFVNSLVASWTAATSAFVDYYEVEWGKTSSSNKTVFTTSDTSTVISPVVDSVQYTVRVRSVSTNGIIGDWASSNVNVVGDTSAPSKPTSPAVSSNYRSNVVKWTNPTDADLKEVEVYANTTNNSGTATKVGSTSGTSFIHAGLPQNTTRYYWMKAKDYTGNASAFSTVTSGTTLSDPADGSDGTNGDTVITGRVYYQTLQSSAPSAPTATSFNVSTASFTGLTTGWALTQPKVDITDTSIKEWSSAFTVTIDGSDSTQTIVFTAPTGAIQVADDIESDNFVTGVSGWQIQRDTGYAEFGSAAIRGTLTASQIKIDNITLDSDGNGNLIIKSGGVDTGQVKDNAISNVGVDEDGSASASGSTYVTAASVTFAGVSGSKVLVNSFGLFGGAGGPVADGLGYARLRHSTLGTLLVANQNLSGPVSLATAFTAASGSQTVYLEINKQTGDVNNAVTKATLAVAQLKK